MRTCEESSDESCLGREEPAGSIVRAVSVFARLCNQPLEHCVADSRYTTYLLDE